MGLATVYRVLSQLEGAGLLSRNVFDGGKAVFEINEGKHHDHLICQTCGRVDEFSNETIERLQREIAIAQGYELVDHRLALYGRCAACVQARCEGDHDTGRESCFGLAPILRILCEPKKTLIKQGTKKPIKAADQGSTTSATRLDLKAPKRFWGTRADAQADNEHFDGKTTE